MKSPIAFFAFNRPYHTLQTLKSLTYNSEVNQTDLYAFIDGPRKSSEIQLIDNVEKIIRSFESKFKSLTINRSEINLSGAINQKRGITKVLSENESVISIEDDIYVSNHFLAYMNSALELYKNSKEVWHINGFNYPVRIEGQFECFFMRSMQCWGWATWKDRWENFIHEPLSCDPYYLKATFTKKMIHEFDLNVRKSMFWSQVKDNASGKLNNTWDIFWYSFIFLNRGLCLTPKVSVTRNIGHDGSGVHSTLDKEYMSSQLNQEKITNFPDLIQENFYCLNEIRNYLNKKNRLFTRLLKKAALIRDQVSWLRRIQVIIEAAREK